MKKFDLTLFLITLFLGWFGVDKLYKKSTKFFLIKLVANLLVVGVIWNIYDLVTIVLGKYKVNPFE